MIQCSPQVNLCFKITPPASFSHYFRDIHSQCPWTIRCLLYLMWCHIFHILCLAPLHIGKTFSCGGAMFSLKWITVGLFSHWLSLPQLHVLAGFNVAKTLKYLDCLWWYSEDNLVSTQKWLQSLVTAKKMSCSRTLILVSNGNGSKEELWGGICPELQIEIKLDGLVVAACY